MPVVVSDGSLSYTAGAECSPLRSFETLDNLLRKASERIANCRSTAAVLDILLLEAKTISGAASGAIIDNVERGAGVAGFPLYEGEHPVGFLVLNLDKGHGISAAERNAIEILLHQASLAFQLIRLQDEARTCELTEYERATTYRAQELAKTNAVLRNAMDRLATQTELGSFYSHLLKEAANLLHADTAHLSVVDEDAAVLRTLAHLESGKLCAPNCPSEMPLTRVAPALAKFCQSRQVQYLDLEKDAGLFCERAIEFYRCAGHRVFIAVPLMLSETCIGYIGLAFLDDHILDPAQQELLQTLAQHATLAVHLTRLAEKVRRGAVLEERIALAREMHDTLLQGFTGVTLQLRALLKSHPQASFEIKQTLESIETEATRSVREARRAVGDMRGNEPGSADLVTALQELVQNQSARTSTQLRWRLEGEPRELSHPIAESLFRIAREALSNALRHAQANCIEVSLLVTAKFLRLSVRDNGRGFDLTPDMARAQGHWGLVGMGERAERLGGKCKIESKLGRGTTLSAEVPL